MSGPNGSWLYSGATPGADSNNYTLFDSTQMGMGAGAIQNMGSKRLIISIVNNPQAGTLKLQASADGGTTWVQVEPNIAVTAASSSSNTTDWFIDEYRDVRVIWTNGGSAQTGWIVNLSLSDSQVKIT